MAKNFYGGHGIVGAPAPLGTGLAFANKYRGNDRVCLTYFGEGAANQGQVYESFNMASLWKLPVIYVIENNHYAMGTHVERGSALAEELYHRGSVVRHSRRAGRRHGCARGEGRGRARRSRGCAAGDGPMILEMRTYRYRGHSMSDPAKYRTREEVQEMRDHRDPIELVAQAAARRPASPTRSELKEIDRTSAPSSTKPPSSPPAIPSPTPAELYTDVVARP